MREIEQDVEFTTEGMKSIKALADSLDASFKSNMASRKSLEVKIKDLKMRSENELFVEAEIVKAEAEMDLYNSQALQINYDLVKLNAMLDKVEDQKNMASTVELRQPLTIQRPPGSLMLHLAEIVVSKKKFERDCMAALADWHEEYFEALDQKRGNTKMAAIRIRHTWAFLKATGCLVVLQMAGKLVAKLVGKIGGA